MLNILFQDQDLLILNKPPNILCVPGLSDPLNLFDLARAEFPNIRVVHRLDMATSGIVIFALNHGTQKHLGKQFENRTIKKRYDALVAGRVAASSGEIVLPLLCDWPNRPKQKVDWHGGKQAHTYFKVKRRHRDMSELWLYPVTGRSHQLRVHCLGIGHPILGDKLYAKPDRCSRMMLHAERIQLRHPRSNELLQINCPAAFSDDSDLAQPLS